MLGFAESEIDNSLEDWLRLVHFDDVADVREKIAQHRSGQNALSSKRISHSPP
jgi:hypothetical protein